ncbi:uncharacterized protein B0I36DRAFT_99359 [Microdochium trichocladiopsis]|uniref:Zn(2)-C6 fungal-type domain-containing protein n=1 Tax=Microdochium trichocladiopsis TaxID=1682393 RepID=A0A9P8Y7Y4_9PEZI|nr:uncharacterized protein B0I36DRAFT_99359 [Microdochium trichocladiopsis]KAH7032643.1 hypothetical protein B0I36DRAFT_99359 [Microdochium trichocladiopsis]
MSKGARLRSPRPEQPVQKTVMTPHTKEASYSSLTRSHPRSFASGDGSERSDTADHSGDSSDRSLKHKAVRNSPLPRRRACRPKVRTGCVTCKSRHVKCDEGKPTCEQCARLSLKCGGYPPPKVKKAISRAERLLLPRPKEASLAPARTRSPLAVAIRPAVEPAPAPMPSSANIFDSDNDTWYFALFRDQVIPELSPYHGTRFWHQILHRDSTIHQCIRHCILSIGAYARAILELRQEKPWEKHASHPWRSPSPYCPHFRASLEHNTKALHSLRSHLRLHGADNRLTMAATLLFIVFQNMQGNFHRSGDLIRTGIKIMKNMRSGPKSSRKGLGRHHWNLARHNAGDDESEMATMFARHSISYVFVPFHHAKFAYHLLITDDSDDDDDTDSDGGDGESSKAGVRGDQDIFDDFVAQWPQTISEAQTRWDYLLPVLASFQSKTVWHNLNPSIESDHLATLDEQAGLLSELHSFQSALDSLATATLSANGFMPSDDARKVELLQLQVMMAVVFVSCCTDPTEMSYDGFLQEFETVLSRVEDLTRSAPQNDKPTKIGFTNEAGVLQLLAFIGAKCRVQRVRHRAMALLKEYEWREGNWDGVSLALGLEGIMQLEGQWSSTVATRESVSSAHLLSVPRSGPCGTMRGLSISPTPEVLSTTPMVPPPQSRYTWTNMFWDFDKRHLTFAYSRVMRDELGEFQTAAWKMDESRIINEWSYASSS